MEESCYYSSIRRYDEDGRPFSLNCWMLPGSRRFTEEFLSASGLVWDTEGSKARRDFASVFILKSAERIAMGVCDENVST